MTGRNTKINANLRNAAKGEHCTFRFPGCQDDTETTCLCHIRNAGNGGVSIKPPDITGAIGCHYCHDVIDRRRKVDLSSEEMAEYVLDALCRTHDLWRRRGLVRE